jgi:proline racemase
MYGCILTPPVTPEADLGVLFMHNEGYSTMCGHGIIALVTTLFETGAFPATDPHTPINLDTPAGLVRATAHLDDKGHVERVSFLNVASFLYARNVEIELPPFGKLAIDIAFGGAFYGFLPAEYVGLSIKPEHVGQLVATGEAIKMALNKKMSIRHPFEEDLGFLYGTIFIGPPENPSNFSRNVCIFANGEVDRSPTGTGVSARLALHYAKGEISEGQSITIESILGASSTFSGQIIGQTTIGPYPAVIPEVSGTAFITGRHEFLIDPRDELGGGFFLS